MADVLERLALLSGSGGPRNRAGSAGRFVIEDLLIGLGWIKKRHVVEMLLVKYGGQPIEMDETLRMLDKRWHQQAATYRLSNDQIEDLCRLAIAEHLDDRRCGHCRGTGEIMRTVKGSKRPMVCPSCGGNGCYRYSGRAKAKALGIHKNTWRDRKLDKVYGRMLQSLSAWESWGRRRMNQHLK
jgi:hypothetical protein